MVKEEEEKIIAVVTRASQKQRTWNPFAHHGNIIVFSSKRIFFLPTIGVVKGIAVSSLSLLGTWWAIKELKEEDKIAENISIRKCEEKAERIIQNGNISEFKTERKFGIKAIIITTTDDERIQIGTLDQTALEKVEKEFPKYLKSS